MSVTLTTADAALKNIYLDVVRDQLNLETTAVYNKIKTSTRDIVGGKNVTKLAPFGVNGGYGAGTETGALPTSGGNKYVNFVSGLKKLYGVIEISDLAIESSKSDVSSFVNLLKAEMEGLMKGAKFSYGRQVYMDGVGKLTATAVTDDSVTVNVASTQYLIEGMIIDIHAADNSIVTKGTQRRIAAVDHTNSTITLEGTDKVTTIATGYITEQGSLNNEITGFGAVFASTGSLYGLDRANYPWLIPHLNAAVGAISDKKLIKAMSTVKNRTGAKIDFAVCHPDVIAEYYDYLEATKRSVNTVDLKGGFSAISINGIPVTDDKFVSAASLYMLDTNQWTFHNLADWDWMTDDKGSVLTKVAGYPKYTAVIRKYAELICDHPGAQVLLSGITITA